ncbi:MAG: peptide ABC transporter substrate-binding protein [Candidatus Hydrogenedens sp.]|nr:peptide ABC transporter substrate-binding protein [Candidatus Hydrogenedens sp.]
MYITKSSTNLICKSVLFLVLIPLSCTFNTNTNQDTLYVGNGAEVQDLDPATVSGVTEHRVLSSLFEGLTSLDPKSLQPFPAVAETWDISDDKKLYTFHLRKNAFWSNGEPVTSIDFLNSWKRILSPKLSAEYAYLLFCIKNAKQYYEGHIEDFNKVGVKIIDDYTLQVELEYPTAYFLKMQVHNIWYPIHKKTIEKYGNFDERNNPWTHAGKHISNGPYQLIEWIPNKIIKVRKNPYYWNKESVAISNIYFYPIDNQMTEERFFRIGYLDLTSTIPLRKLDYYRINRPESLLLYPYIGVYYYRINVKKAPLNNIFVRKALAYAIDSSQITKYILKGGETPATHYVPNNIGDYLSPEIVRFNPKYARELLYQAGYPDGKNFPTIEILFNTSEAHKLIAEAIQRMWKQHLNINVKLLNQDWKVYLSSLNQLDYQIARSAWIADFLDPINFLECFLSYSGNNRTGWANNEFDNKIEQAYHETDGKTRNRLMFEAEQILLDELPIIPIYFYTWKMLISSRVDNLNPNVLGYIRWQDLKIKEQNKSITLLDKR